MTCHRTLADDGIRPNKGSLAYSDMSIPGNNVNSNLQILDHQRMENHVSANAWVTFVIYRSFLILGCLMVAVTPRVASGQWFKKLGGFGNRPQPTSIPVAFGQPPTQTQFLQWQQRHTANVKQLDAKVQIAMTGTPKLRGTLQLELPKRLRLKAGVLGMNEMGVDVGSNDDLFWIWTRVALPGQSPTLMYAHHEQFKNSSSAVRNAIPLEPEWLVEALGLVDFSKYESHSDPVPQSGGRMQMISGRSTANGKQYRVTIFDGRRGLIEQQALYDQQGTLIAYTNMSNYRHYPQHSVSLPGKIEMHLFQNGQDVTMTVTTDSFRINALYGDPARMWHMPDPAGVQKIDLAPAARVSQPLPQYGQTPVPTHNFNPAGYTPAPQSLGASSAVSASQLPRYQSGQPNAPVQSTRSRLPAIGATSSPVSPQQNWGARQPFSSN